MSIIAELWDFMKTRKKLWLLPIVLVTVMLGALVLIAQSSAVTPFIYAIF